MKRILKSDSEFNFIVDKKTLNAFFKLAYFTSIYTRTILMYYAGENPMGKKVF